MIIMLSDERHIDALALEFQELNAAAVRVTSFEVARTAGLLTALPSVHPAPLLIWGERDNLGKDHLDENVALVRAARPDAVTRIVPGAGHWLPFEIPGVFAPMILAQLAP